VGAGDGIVARSGANKSTTHCSGGRRPACYRRRSPQGCESQTARAEYEQSTDQADADPDGGVPQFGAPDDRLDLTLTAWTVNPHVRPRIRWKSTIS